MSHLLDATHWAVNALADAALGEVRRTQRLGELAGVLAQHPTAARPAACGDGAMLTAAYRFLAHDAREPHDILLSHIEGTSGRLAPGPIVLAVHDTTAVDWTAHPATTGLGPLGHTACQGLLVHSTLAFTPERVPLGLVAHMHQAKAALLVEREVTLSRCSSGSPVKSAFSARKMGLPSKKGCA